MVSEVLALLLTFLVNLPFGYWRSSTKKKLSKEWFIAVHAPVPIVFLLRYFSNAPLYHIPIFVILFFAGQSIGGRFRKLLTKRIVPTKCLMMDLIRLAKS